MKEELKDPFELVANALQISRDLINENSNLGETPNWDSLNHVALIGELEAHYNLTISNEEIEKYISMKSIIELYQTLKSK